MHIASVGIDLGKLTFHLIALDDEGNVVIRKKFSRNQLLTYTANLQTSLIGMEACAGAHFIAAALRDQGHDVRLIPAQFVKPFVKSNKNDFIDAEAIAEAVTRKNMRFVPSRRAAGSAGNGRYGTTKGRYCVDCAADFRIREERLFSVSYAETSRTGRTAQKGTFELLDRRCKCNSHIQKAVRYDL